MIYKKHLLTATVISNVLLSSFVCNASHATIEDLPHELMNEIFRGLTPNDIENTQLISQHFKAASDKFCFNDHKVNKFCKLSVTGLWTSPKIAIEVARKVILLTDNDVATRHGEDLLIAKAKAHAFLAYRGINKDNNIGEFDKIYGNSIPGSAISSELKTFSIFLRNVAGKMIQGK
ncbi:F-box protein [Candidatus Paracaedibacter symbiosus]|uniref:F-box protein n=1 Tax=Candidatus Paracaedibacter symbiosus TaxID=244582 RepID=UPI000509BBF6|nr:F-box protein [Candidatus Paracaedibacter symbiosus]